MGYGYKIGAGILVVVGLMVTVNIVGGIDFVNPFAASATCTVKIVPSCLATVCDVNQGNTYVTCERSNPLSVLASMLIPDPRPLVTFGTPCVPLINPGGEFTLDFEVPAAGYARSKQVTTCGEAAASTYTFNYDNRLSVINWELYVKDKNAVQTFYTKTGQLTP